MKALLTGGAGFAGSHLAEYLLACGVEVVVLAFPGEDLANLQSVLPHIRIEYADVRDEERLFHVLRETKPQRLYHLAALSSPSESFQDPKLTYEVNFGGTLQLLSAWRRINSDCRLLYVSSAEVYGAVRSEDLPLREETPLRPTSPYAGSKAAGEFLAVQFFQSYGFPIVRVRPFNHTGPRQSPAFVCSSIARQIAEVEAGLRPPKIGVGNRKVSRDFSDVRDIVRGYHALLERGVPGEVYQLGAGRPIPVEEVLQILLRRCSKQVEVVVDQSRLRTGEVPAVWGDTTKAEKAVGWKRQFSLEHTLGDLVLYWRAALRG